MPLNPLDWTGEPFLALYIGVTTICVLVVLAMRMAISTTPASPGRAILEPIELAWLTGGRRRAADTVLVAFLESGVAELNGKTLTVDPARGTLPGGMLGFAGPAQAATSCPAFRRAIQPELDAVDDALASRGLVPSREQMTRLTSWTKAIFAVPLVLGVLKSIVGLSRDKPIGFLIVLLIVTFFIALWLVRRRPFRTRAGEEASDNARRVMARAARAPEDGEMVLAFALTGAAVLAGRPYAQMLRPASGSGCGGSGCGGGGGDSGGGGCGGCGGGGC